MLRHCRRDNRPLGFWMYEPNVPRGLRATGREIDGELREPERRRLAARGRDWLMTGTEIDAAVAH